jgi:signal transduction histidine kinase
MTDQRILAYEQAARAMARGRFDVNVPVDPDPEDDVARLGAALRSLGNSLEHRFRQIQRVVRVTEEINASLLLEEILEDVYESFREIIPYDRIGLSLLEEDGEETRVRARWARTSSATPKIEAGFWAPLAGSSLEGIIRTGQPRILNDLEAYLAEHPNSTSTRLIVQEGMRSSLTCPLVANGKHVGFLFFSSMERNTYRDLHVELFLEIAGQLSLIVEKSRLYQELVELNEWKNRFLGMAAHDLRNPLNAVLGYLFLMEKGHFGEVTDAQLEVIRVIRDQGNAMVELLEDLLDVNVIQSGHLKLDVVPVDLRDLVEAEVEAARPMAEDKSIRLATALPDEPVLALADPHRIRQVLANLISNAVKYSLEGTGTVVTACTGEEAAHVAVEDQGQGIPPHELANLFTEFGRTSVRPTGDERSTGLGLAIVGKIVEAHGGEVSVDSRVGEGSSFRFNLPIPGR